MKIIQNAKKLTFADVCKAGETVYLEIHADEYTMEDLGELAERGSLWVPIGGDEYE
jgi:hypothetical protein